MSGVCCWAKGQQNTGAWRVWGGVCRHARGKGSGRQGIRRREYEFLKVVMHQKQFFNEVDVLYSLKHPNIVEMVGASSAFVEKRDLHVPPFIVFEALPMSLYTWQHIDMDTVKVSDTDQ